MATSLFGKKAPRPAWLRKATNKLALRGRRDTQKTTKMVYMPSGVRVIPVPASASVVVLPAAALAQQESLWKAKKTTVNTKAPLAPVEKKPSAAELKKQARLAKQAQLKKEQEEKKIAAEKAAAETKRKLEKEVKAALLKKKREEKQAAAKAKKEARKIQLAARKEAMRLKAKAQQEAKKAKLEAQKAKKAALIAERKAKSEALAKAKAKAASEVEVLDPVLMAPTGNDDVIAKICRELGVPPPEKESMILDRALKLADRTVAERKANADLANAVSTRTDSLVDAHHNMVNTAFSNACKIATDFTDARDTALSTALNVADETTRRRALMKQFVKAQLDVDPTLTAHDIAILFNRYYKNLRSNEQQQQQKQISSPMTSPVLALAEGQKKLPASQPSAKTTTPAEKKQDGASYEQK